MNKQEIEKRLSTDEDRCKYCNSSTISGGDIYCSAGYSHDMNCDGKDFNLDYKIEEVISALEQQLTNGWIPVSEGLPEIRQLYDVSLRYENFSGIYEITRMADYIGDGEWNIYGPQPVIATRHIMAWKNQTEPYKEVSND